MKNLYLLGAATAALGYSHGTTETVLVKGSDGPIRVNKSDFDADQAGDKTMTEFKGKDPTEGDNDGKVARGTASDVNVTGAHGVQTTAAPSAPDFSGGDATRPLPMYETKNAAAPAATTADQLLVMKQGSGKSAKFFITDGMGQKITGDRAKLLGIEEAGYDSEEAAKLVQSTTEPKPTP